MKRYLLCLLLSVFSLPLQAGFEEAIEAARANNQAAAFTGFQEAAEAGDKRAFGRLGGMYLYGLGTAKDYGKAYIWFGLAAASGDQYAEKFQRAASSMLQQADLPALEQQIASYRKRLQIGPEPAPEASAAEAPARAR